MKYLITIVILLITFLLEKNWISKKSMEHFNFTKKKIKHSIQKINIKPIIWIYIPTEVSTRFWKHFYSRKSIQQPNSIIELCVKTIYKHNEHFTNIQIIDDDNIKDYIPENKINQFNKIPNTFKSLYIKFHILYNYGGLWLENSTLCFKSLKEIFDKLALKDMITFDCSIIKSNISCNKQNRVSLFSIAARKNNPIIKNILDFIIERSNSLICNFNIEDDISNILKLNESKIYHFENTQRDYQNKSIHIDNLISHNYTVVKNPDLLFMVVDLSYIKKYRKYQWLLRLNQQQLLESNMWLSKLFRYALRMEQKVYLENNMYHDSTNHLEINLVPDDLHELKYIVQNSNLYQEHPYRLVHKEPIRNT